MSKYEDAYNEMCKRILSYKVVLAPILKYCLDEYADYDYDKIVRCLEEGSHLPRIKGLTNDFDVIRYDLVFHAVLPGQTNGVLINIEAQRTTKLKYELYNRAVFYKGHLIAYQADRYIKDQEYDELQKVVTIWICFDASTKEEENSMCDFSLSKRKKVGYNRIEKKIYDKETIVFIYLGKRNQQIRA